MNKVLFAAPHPDDETLGCGGTILKHKAEGDEIYWLLMTNISEEEGYGKTKVLKRQEEIDKAAKEYGFKGKFKLDFPTTKLDMIPRHKLIEKIGNIIETVKPDIIYLPNRNDVHSDHKIVFESVFSTLKTFRSPFVKKVLMYEIISETEFAPALIQNVFVPNSFSDISEYLGKKVSIMKIFKSEMGKHPFPRSVENIKALAAYRGATAGVKYAEAFMILKEIW